MSGKKRFALNIGMNWMSMAVNMVVPFFLMPFVVRHIGPVGYGVWILTVSTVSYLNLLDLGLRSAIIRFVSKSTAEGNFDEAQKAIGAALWFRLLIAAGVACISVGLALLFPHLFKIPYELRHASQIMVLLSALGVAVGLVSGVYGGVLSGVNRFDVNSSITVAQTFLRAAGYILILRHQAVSIANQEMADSHSLIAMASWELAVILFSSLLTCGAAMKIYPPCRIHIRRPDIATLKMIWSYSFKTFIIIIAVQIVFYTDNLVVGAFLSVGAVTLYSIAGSLAMYSGQVSSAMGATFIPMASGLDAAGQTKDLQRLLLRGTQAALGLMLPIGITLLLRGKTFIGLWMGPQYGHTSGTILQILLISQFFTIANSTAGQIAYGVDKHKSVATWSAIEAIFNLSLSLVLVKTVGLYGVAWGTSISMSIIHLIFWPRFVKKELGIPVRRYLWQGWAKITLCSIPFALASLFADNRWHASSLLVFFIQIALTLPIFALSLLLVFNEETIGLFRRWRLSRVANISSMS
jgi:O-antigen/teichoic acid export membrane protein